MIIASPWTRGGFVNSELFDHTSSLQFPENFLETKFNKKIKEDNITQWRRTICGDLTSVFRPYHGEKINSPEFLEKKKTACWYDFSVKLEASGAFEERFAGHVENGVVSKADPLMGGVV